MIQDHEQARTNRRKEGQTKDISYKTLPVNLINFSFK